jgi:hypothetical protein
VKNHFPRFLEIGKQKQPGPALLAPCKDYGRLIWFLRRSGSNIRKNGSRLPRCRYGAFCPCRHGQDELRHAFALCCGSQKKATGLRKFFKKEFMMRFTLSNERSREPLPTYPPFLPPCLAGSNIQLFTARIAARSNMSWPLDFRTGEGPQPCLPDRQRTSIDHGSLITPAPRRMGVFGGRGFSSRGGQLVLKAPPTAHGLS